MGSGCPGSQKKTFQLKFSISTNRGGGEDGVCTEIHPIWSMAVAKNGKQLAAATGNHQIHLWCLVTYRILISLRGHGNTVWQVCYSPDNRLLASASADGTIRLWEVDTGFPLSVLPRGDANWVWCVAFSPDSSTLVSGGADTKMTIWDVKACLDVTRPNSGAQLELCDSSAGSVQRWTLFNKTRATETLMAREEDGGVTCLWGPLAVKKACFAPEMGYEAYGSGWDVTEKVRELLQYSAKTSRISYVQYDDLLKFGDPMPGIPKVLIVEMPQVFEVVLDKDCLPGQDAHSMPANDIDECKRICFEEGFGAFVVRSGRAYFKSQTCKECTMGLTTDRSAVTYLKSKIVKGNERLEVPGGPQGLVRAFLGDPYNLWNPYYGEDVTDLARAVLARGGTLVADKREMAREIMRCGGSVQEANDQAFGYIGDTPAGVMKALVIEDLQPVAWKWFAHEKSIHGVTFAPRESRKSSSTGGPEGNLASVGADGTLAIWDAYSQRLKCRLMGHIGAVTTVSISAMNDRVIATGGDDQTVRLWSLSDMNSETVKESLMSERGYNLAHHILRGHQEGVTSVRFCADGRLLASSSKDMYVYIWNASVQPTLHSRFLAHEAWVRAVEWTEDMTTICTASTDGILSIWERRLRKESKSEDKYALG